MRTKTTVQPTYCHSAPAWVKTIRDQSFYARGPSLYNKLPPELRDIENIATSSYKHLDQFKTQFDQFLSKIPDQPGGVTSNSLLDQV